MTNPAPHRRNRHHVFETAAGFCGIAWNEAGVVRFRLPTRDAGAAERLLLRGFDSTAAAPPPQVETIITAARRYFDGEQIDFSGVPVDLDTEDDLFRRIYEALRQVPWGSTTTYGGLAKAIGGGPMMARDVGQAMGNNPVPLIIPCHRVLAAGGKPGGFSAPGGVDTKLHMLKLEGVDLNAAQAAAKPAQKSAHAPDPAQRGFGF